jgi:hypothetical protein
VAAALTPTTEPTFVPARTEDERPAVRIGEVLIFTYTDGDGDVRVTVDTEDVTTEVPIRINVNGGTVWEGTSRG